MLTACKCCGKMQHRLVSGFKKVGRVTRRIYADEKNKRWYGLMCPTCYNEDKNGKKQEKTKRRCRKCDCFLPPSRYYECYECKEVLPEDDGDLIYA